jgi:2-keto-4-pentenoate hydratase/2-oxohepta-3-ene-1,7-dioic acid hydratase in catechol pathway
MRLLRIGAPGSERPAALTADGRLLDLSGAIDDVDGSFLAEGVATVAGGVENGSFPEVRDHGRVGPPIARPGKIICIGKNYKEHAEETGSAAPTVPIVFLKAPNTIVGPEDEVLIPRGSTKTDWEVELGVVIGRTARYLESHEAALGCVAGYAVANDVSERAFQLERGGQWDQGKSCETFNPLGPWLVTADDIPDPQTLGLRLWVNGTLRQESNTALMIFPVAEIIRWLSWCMVLEPGDLIDTGTPGGVALGMPPPQPYLRPGDVVEAEIDMLGRQRFTMGQA